MSFQEMNKPQLQEICDEYGLDQDGTKADLITRIAEEGVKYADYIKLKEAPKIDPAEAGLSEATVQKNAAKQKNEDDGPDVLVKMERKNYTYEIQGFTFTKEHPIAVMSQQQAQNIFDRQDGFRLATPREATEFYS